MNIAVVFDGELKDGGGYQQQLTTVIELNKFDKYNFIAFVFSDENKKVLEALGIQTIVITQNFFNRATRFFYKQEWFYQIARKYKLKTIFEKKLFLNNIDLVYFLSPSVFSLDLIHHNYIITVWDLCHRDMPEFPEVNFFREFELREELYLKSLKKAVAVLADSESGKRSIIERYGIDEDRVQVVTFAPSINSFHDNKVDVKLKYQINGDYIYYPAQFWSHKNHIYIIDALKVLKEQGVNIISVFSGSDKGNLDYILSYAKDVGVEDLVKYIGFVPNEDIFSLYKNALAMVMPSYFGPTNIPPLEAFAIGTPVIYSDLNGLRDQVENSALLCDLKKPHNLAEHLIDLLESEDLRNELALKGKKRLKILSESSVVLVLEDILDSYAIKLKCWKA